MMRLGRRGLAGFGALCKVLALSTVLTLALASAAFADDLTNLLDNSPDTAIGPLWLENMTLNEGQTGNVPFRLLSVNSDGESGCNISGSENLVVAFASTNTSVAREEPSASTLTFQDGADSGTTACGPSPSGTPPASAPDDETVTVKAVSRGTAEISLSQVSTTNTGSGTFTYGRAKFQVTVNNVAPTISDVPDQGTDEDNPTGAIPFTIGDAGTPASSLAVSGSSSNTTLVPNSSITFDGSGANRTMTVTPEPNLSGAATITVSVGDGAATTTDTFVLTVNATNDQPNAVDDTANANEGGSNATVGVLANDGDVDGDALTITGNTQPPAGEGSVTCSTTSCTFAPAADFHGTTSFTYTASDGNGGTDTATVAVNVAATNDAPEANNDSYGVDEDGTLNVGAPGILANDTDVDDLLGPLTALTAALVNGPEDGTLALDADGSFAYTPDANFNGSDSFTYRANDGTANGNVSTVMINVAAVNDAPDFDLQTNPNQTVNEDAGTQTVVGFATNATAGPANESVQTVSFTVTNDNQALFSGQPTISPNGTLTYAPAPDANGTANVTVTATDNGGTVNGGDNTSGERTFTITVNTVNDVPTLTLSGAANASEGQTKTYGFTVTDPDPGGFTIESGFPDCGDGGVLVVGSLTTTATGGSFECRFPDGPAEPTVRMQVTDEQVADSNIDTRAVTVANVAPSISLTGPATAEEGDTKAYYLAVADPGSDSHTVTSTCGAHGAKVVGSDNYNPSTREGDFQCRFPNGPATSNVTVGVNDSDGAGDSDNRVVSVTVANVAPLARNDGPYQTSEDEPLSIGAPGLLGNDEDPADGNDVLEAELAQDASHGTVELESDGSFTYTPEADYSGTDSFTYEVCDDAPAPLCDGGTANITVAAVNDAPTVTLLEGPDAVNEGDTATYTYTATDHEPGGVTFDGGYPDCGTGGEIIGTPTGNPTGGSFECYFPDGPGESTVRVRVSDLQGEISNIATQDLTIADVAPTITMSGPSNAKQGQTKTFTFAVTDPGEDTFDFAAGYPRCGNGAVLVGEIMGTDSGSFQCKFVKPTKQTLVVRVEDLDGGLSNMASWQVKVKKSKVRLPFANQRGSEATAPAAEDTSADR